MPTELIVAVAIAVALYAIAVLALVAIGRRSDARALAGFVPDCVVLFRRPVRGGGADRVRGHWPGPEASLRVLLRLSGARVS